MKPFAQYLAESERTYMYRIKIVGDLTSDFNREFREQLKKFEPVSVKETKKTPILSQPAEFPGFPNQAINMIDIELRYPATFPQVQQMARLLGLEPDRICMNNLAWSQGMDQELLGIQDQNKNLLTTDYPEPSAEQKAASRDYTAVGADKAVVKNSAAGAAWTIAGGAPPPAATTDQLPQGVTSPMTNIKRPAKPQVGRTT